MNDQTKTPGAMVLVPRQLLQCAYSSVAYLALRGDDVGTSNVPTADALRALLDTVAEQTPAVGGEPVAWMVSDKGISKCYERFPHWAADYVVEPLYLRPQPATAKAVLPERMEVYSALDTGWNACLDEIAKLNPQIQ